MSDVTLMLNRAHAGDPQAAGELLVLVYDELRRLAAVRMANERAGNTLQPTALVHEAWLRLGEGACFENRAHFFSAAAEAMRHILIDAARRKLAARHGGGQERVRVEDTQIAAPAAREDELLAVHDALDALAVEDPDKAELVKLRFFVGMPLKEAAGILGLSERTAKRHWSYAKAWLADAMRV